MDLFIVSEKCFTGTVLFYLMATVLYLIYLGWHNRVLGGAATASAIAGVSFHTFGLALRWIQAGFHHPPFTNLYESLLFFAWGIALFYVILEWKYKIRMAGAFIFPIALGGMGAAVLSGDKQIEQLVPALQSNWLHAHVAIASLAYAAFVASFGLSLMYLIKDQVGRERIGAAAAFSVASLLAICDKFQVLLGNFRMDNLQAEMTGDKFISFPLPGRLLLAGLIFSGVAGILYLAAPGPEEKKPESQGSWPRLILLLGFLFTLLGFLALIFQVNSNEATRLFSNPFKIVIIMLAALTAAGMLILDFKYDSIAEALPSAEFLDRLSYVSVMIAYPLMTAVIITGAVWANYAWGTYWSWDPKETASLITWLIYTLYLHARITANWTGRPVALISIIGFVSVVFTFLGVNILLSGLHSYGSA